ncbi:hypothetical protein [Providencia rettgeri]|uniref:hypothetical protein n=1 Tax=Providencia rettgeri TaxID=587 RepID=UPI001F03374E|nr:hypothetical protein [Providencia rettgeri]MCG9943696.1 hypothetical protein [Providencia rettgeri]
MNNNAKKFSLSRLFELWDLHAVAILPLSGIFFLFLGQVMIAYEVWVKFFTMVSSLGMALLGGSLFLAITKTSQYTKFFQDRIYDVFYSPQKSVPKDLLVSKWKTLTHFLLQRTAGDLHKDVANEILKRYFNDDIHYYFQETTEIYDITLESDLRTARIKKRVIHRVVINNNREDANIIHKIVYRTQSDLKAIYVDNEIVDISNCVERENIKINGEDFIFATVTINLKNDRKSKILERYYEKTQDIINDPLTIVNNSKFIQHLTVRHKSTNCDVKIVPTGSVGSPKSRPDKYVDADGYTRVIISPIEGLTLPGEGYILFIAPQKEPELNLIHEDSDETSTT